MVAMSRFAGQVLHLSSTSRTSREVRVRAKVVAVPLQTKGTHRARRESPNAEYVGPVSLFYRRLSVSLATGGHPNRATSL